jgi:2-polyprenyl-3-methyl-5-hydroxy-6-metoxy-1,4-benzoquinol methylase
MSGDVEGVAAARYRWTDAVPEASHGYLDTAVFRAIHDRFDGLSSCQPQTRIFDAGCGNGALLARLHAAGVTTAGCELSPEGVAIARGMLGPAVRVECMSVYDDLAASFGGDWDAVVSTEVVEHLFAPRQFVQRIRGLLRPGGVFVLSTPYHGYLKNLALAASGRMDAHFTALWDGGHIKFWSYRTLRALLAEAGFEDFRFYGAGRLPWLWKSMVVSCRKH